MKKVIIIGHFGFSEKLSNGQTIKTKIITTGLEKQLGKNEVEKIDTHGGKKTLFKAPFQVIRALKNAKNIIILPAHNGLRIYAPLLSFFRRFFKNRKLHYVVIGGWLPEYLINKKWLSKILKKFDGIYVETNTMKKALEEQGFNNVLVMPNCKELTPLAESELVYAAGEPYKLCTFSRVIKEKGIEDAVNAVKAVNDHFGRTVYELDIYGQVDQNQSEWFEKLRKTFPPYIKYGGLVPFDKSVETLKNYFALLFPTHFFTEGIPGTIIDAYATGIPVISAKWESYSDVVVERKTGAGYEFDNQKQFENILLSIAQNPKILLDMKVNCIEKAKDYTTETAIQILADKFC